MLAEAEQFYGQGRLADAETRFRDVLEEDPGNQRARESLVVVCLQSERPIEAREFLQGLIADNPDEAIYCDRLNSVCEINLERDIAVAAYRALLQRRGDLSVSRYNLAHLLKRMGEVEAAEQEYKTCLDQGIENPAEVHTNLSVIYTEQGRDDEAEQALKTALQLEEDYTPALYNLALLREEQGDWKEARSVLNRLLAADVNHVDALVRLANGETFRDTTGPTVRKITRALKREGLDAAGREQLHYALGKIYDDCAKYDDAMVNYSRANEFSRERVAANGYQPLVQEVMVSDLCAHSADWMAAVEPVSDAAPIFVCGMFRSGSTLLEQVLAAHPQLQAGGEIEYFGRQLGAMDAAYPALLGGLDDQTAQRLGEGYIALLESRGLRVDASTNKRPDNFLYLGLIKALFPNVRILHTARNPLDTCLSIFFQPLADELSYANDIKHVGHYYLQYRRLMNFWAEQYPDSILHIPYEGLVQNPKAVIEPALHFLGLEWDDACLNFYEVENRVRTASVAQVRQPLYQTSAGRAGNYAKYLEPLKHYLESGLKDL